MIPYGKPNMNCHFTYVTVFLNSDHCIWFKGFVWSQTRQVNQVGRFRENNWDIARLCLQMQRFSSSLQLQIVTILSTNSNENAVFFIIFPIWMESQNAISIRISPCGTVVDVYALQIHANHEIDWENNLKQIGP